MPAAPRVDWTKMQAERPIDGPLGQNMIGYQEAIGARNKIAAQNYSQIKMSMNDGPQKQVGVNPQQFVTKKETIPPTILAEVPDLLKHPGSVDPGKYVMRRNTQRPIRNMNPLMLSGVAERQDSKAQTRTSLKNKNPEPLNDLWKTKGLFYDPLEIVNNKRKSHLPGWSSKGTATILPPSLSELDLYKVYNDIYWDQEFSVEKLNNIKKPSQKQTQTNIVTVVFVRHGQSTMNKSGTFQGWIDAPLSDQGQSECHEAGKQLRDLGYHFDVAYTSELCRATKTTDIILEEMGLSNHTEIHKSWRLNERHYGQLQGMSKQKTVDQFGKDQVKLWRQSFDDPPPKISFEHETHPRFDTLYDGLSEEEYREMPVGESLKMVRQRVEAYWKEQILPGLKDMGGKQVLFSTHKHVLRGMVQYLAELDNDQIPQLIIPNAAPFVFEFDISKDFKVVRNYYIEDESQEVFENVKPDEAGLS